MEGGRGRLGPGGRLVPAAAASSTSAAAAALPVGQAGVVLARRLVQRLGVLHEVGVAAHGLGLDPADDGAGSRRARPSGEEHDAAPAAGHGQVHEARGDRQGRAGAARDALVGGDRPGILPQVVQDGLERHGALRYGEEEALQDVLGGSSGSGCRGLLRVGAGSSGMLLVLVLLGVGHVGVAAQQLPDPARAVLLVAPQHVRLGDAAEAQLVDLHVGAEGDETDEGVVGEEVDGLLEAVGQLGQLLGHGARVDAEQKGRRTRRGDAGQLVLARGVLRDELGGEVGLADVLAVVGGEVIPRQAERAHPQLGAEVHLAVRVEDGVARGRAAADGIVLEGLRRGAGRRQLLEGRHQGADGSDAAGRLQPARRPAVEGEAGAALLLRRGHVPRLLLHGCGI